MLKNDQSDEIWRQDKDHFLHPWTHFDSFNRDGSLVLREADGIYTYDIHGNRYIDGVGGLWCVNIGYGREEMVEAIADQVREMAYANPFSDVTNIPAARLAAKLAELAPGDLNHAMLTCGGSTANDSAYRLIQYYWGCQGQTQRRHVLTRRGSYHGSTYITQSLTGKPGDRQREFGYETNTIHHVAEPNAYRPPEGISDDDFENYLIDDFEQTVKKLGADNIAAHFAEPILGAGGVVVPPQGYIEATRNICQQHGIVYVADEVVTGFGRLGAWFASRDVFNIQPDIIVCAKGITSGYQPLGATLYSDHIHEIISEHGHDRLFTNGYTYSGHPVACAAALKNIEIIEREQLCETVRNDTGPYFMEQLNSLRDLPTVGDVRGRFLMGCIVNVADKTTRQEFDPQVDIGKRIAKAAGRNGLMVRPIGNLNVLSPPLTINRKQIDDLVDVLRRSMLEVIDELKSDHLL